MAEAGEVGHWAVLGKLNETAGESEISELVEWALPIQERHFADVKDGSLKLAGRKTPTRSPSSQEAPPRGHRSTVTLGASLLFCS
ncbi:MAG TPA: hypothetical protein VN758_08470 [Solirubrobacterales bacterium]|nr:hypothetical protein [Solirubrobacterales bacterium]